MNLFPFVLTVVRLTGKNVKSCLNTVTHTLPYGLAQFSGFNNLRAFREGGAYEVEVSNIRYPTHKSTRLPPTPMLPVAVMVTMFNKGKMLSNGESVTTVLIDGFRKIASSHRSRVGSLQVDLSRQQ